MKKIILIAAMLYTMSFCGGAAYADNTAAYTGGNVNTAKIIDTSNNYSTVLITKALDDPIANSSIVYVNQADTIFNATMDFLIKENPDVGIYNVKLGSIDGTEANMTLYIGVNSDKPYADTPMARLSRTETLRGYYTAGFELVTTGSVFSGYKSIKVGYIKNNHTYYGGFPLNEHWTPEISGNGSIMLVFVLDHIEEDELPSVSVFLSNDTLGSGSAYVEE